MRIAHFDCFSGISGDMTLAALLDLGVPREPVLAGIASLGLPIKIGVEKVRKGGFAATQSGVRLPISDPAAEISIDLFQSFRWGLAGARTRQPRAVPNDVSRDYKARIRASEARRIFGLSVDQG